MSETPYLVARLRAAGCVYAEEEARLLRSAADSPRELAAMVHRRVSGVPLEHILGWAEFCGMRIAVEPGVFVPRRRTEFLVEQAASLTPAAIVVVDLCCGSGAVGVALAARVPRVELHAVDVDPAAVRCARRNLARVGEVYQGDLYSGLPDALRGRVEIMVANAPYVPTVDLALMPAEARLHEPATALAGGTDGLDVHRRVAAGAPSWLAPGGHLLIETSERQARVAVDLMERAGLAAGVVRSEQHQATVVVGQLQQ